MKLLLLFSLLLTGLSLQGGSLFTDNFESYTPGSNLSGQGGWSGCGSIPVAAGSGLPTQVASVGGGSSSGCTGSFAGLAFLQHSLAGSITSDSITTMSFDAYAVPGSGHVTVDLNNRQLVDGQSNFVGIEVLTTDGLANPGWEISTEGGSGTKQEVFIPGNGSLLSMKLVIDMPDQIAYGIYDLGSGPQTTSAINLAGVDLTLVDRVEIVGDYRSGSSTAEIDNLDVTQTPEPSTLLMTAFPGLVIFGMKLRTRRSGRKLT
jgi:hypothetical protein